MRKILCDLDCTLIDGELRVDMELKVAMEYGIIPSEYARGRDIAVAKNGGISNFNYDRLYAGLEVVKPGLSRAIIKDLYDIIAAPLLFPDTLQFLDSFPKDTLALLTTGDPAFQNMKIDANGLREKFSEIMIVPSPKCTSFVDPPPGMIYLDDSPREIDAMKTAHPQIFCVLMRNPAPWEHHRTSYHKDAYAPDLVEAAKIIKNRPS